MSNRCHCGLYGLLSVCLLMLQCSPISDHNDTKDDSLAVLRHGGLECFIHQDGFRFGFKWTDGASIALAHKLSGILLDGEKANVSETFAGDERNDGKVRLTVSTASGHKAEVTISIEDKVAIFKVRPEKKKFTKISLRLAGMALAHGLGDAGSYGESFNLLENISDQYFLENNGGTKRWVSSFAIFPKNSLAGVFFDEGAKTVTLNAEEYQMELTKKGEATFYYFFGRPVDIYKNYKSVRAQKGYQDVKPKFRLFELGWESWDALGWNTNQQTVQEILYKFHQNGYPIRWAVTGSGFWESGGTTTSFGKWGEKFADAPAFKSWMHDQDIKWMIGLRTNFVPSGGPYYPTTANRDRNLKVDAFKGNEISNEAIAKGFFVSHGDANVQSFTSPVFPIVPSYLLDGKISGAAQWYQQQYLKWDVDGIKEDTMMDTDSLSDIYNAPITEIADQGGLVMARNGQFIAPGTLLRINDTGVEQISRRIPINYLQYAASGFPNVYSDVAGVHNMDNIKDIDRSIRHAWLLSLTAGMAVGAYPDDWPVKEQKIFKKAIDFHYSLAPYMYSAAMDSYYTGYPYTLTPLTIAFPEDSMVSKLKHFQWMIGESILAAPLVKNHHSSTMEVYLPEGTWYDFESGEKYQGPALLENFKVPLDKIPCFVGGKGIIVERKSQKLLARVYPIAQVTEFKFTARDGKTNGMITIDSPDWSNIKIIDQATNREVSFEKAGHAFLFDFVEGHNYVIK